MKSYRGSVSGMIQSDHQNVARGIYFSKKDQKFQFAPEYVTPGVFVPLSKQCVLVKYLPTRNGLLRRKELCKTIKYNEAWKEWSVRK